MEYDKKRKLLAQNVWQAKIVARAFTNAVVENQMDRKSFYVHKPIPMYLFIYIFPVEILLIW